MAVKAITTAQYESEVLQSPVPVLIDFWAPWCNPCRMLAPIVEEASEEATDKKFVKVNVDESPDLAEKFGIMSIPTLVVMKNGQMVSKNVGGRSKEQILALLA